MTTPAKNISPNPMPLHTPCRHTQLLGHRGARGEQPENTPAGFEHLQRLFHEQTQTDCPTSTPLVGVEFDVQMTADNQLVVFHDDNLFRIFGHQSRVDELRLASLQRLTQNKVALLTDMPTLLAGYTHIEMEIKTHARTNHRALADAVTQTLTHPSFLSLPITVTSFDTRLHASLQNHAEFYRLGYGRGLIVNQRFAPQRFTPKNRQAHPNAQQEHIIATALRLGCQHISWQYDMITPHTLTQCRQHDMGISAWTVNTRQAGKRLADVGVDYLITDYPSRFMGLAI